MRLNRSFEHENFPAGAALECTTTPSIDKISGSAPPPSAAMRSTWR